MTSLNPDDLAESKARKYERIDPDVRLMLQVRDGNAAAFEKLVQKYQGRLVSLLEHIVPNRDQAEDLAQEVFMRVYRARKTYVPGAKFSTWLFTITHNVASNAIRRHGRRKEINLVNSPSGKVTVQAMDRIAPAKSGWMPTRQLDSREIGEIVRSAILTLNERQRTAMMLSRFEEMSYQEIAETMGMTPQAIKSLLSRARANLRDALQPYFDSGALGPSIPAPSPSDSDSHERGVVPT